MKPLPRCLFVLVATIWMLPGCERKDVRVYTAPKDAPPPEPARAAENTEEPPRGPSRVEQARRAGKFNAATPAGWQQTESSDVVVANYVIKSADGDATVSATPLPNLAGREEMVVNMWRSQLGLGPLASEDAAKSLSDVEVAGGAGKLFEVAGTNDGKPLRIVTAVRHLPDASWFFKLAGPEAAVQAQKAAFLDFVKNARIDESAEPAKTADAATTQPGAEAPQFHWTVPAGWQESAPGQMQVAKFSVAGADGTKADVAVSIFPSDTGGTLANVNRWRAQLGLPPVDEAAMRNLVAPLEQAPGAVLADLANDNRRMLGAIVPRSGQWFFYKMIGDAPAVAEARPAFIQFVTSAP